MVAAAAAADPAPITADDVVEIAPTAPADCKEAMTPPAATPPPLAMAEEDIIQAAILPAFIPAAPKPILCTTETAIYDIIVVTGILR